MLITKFFKVLESRSCIITAVLLFLLIYHLYVKPSSAAVGFIAYNVIQLYLFFRNTIKWQCEGFFSFYFSIWLYLFGSAISVLKTRCVTVEWICWLKIEEIYICMPLVR